MNWMKLLPMFWLFVEPCCVMQTLADPSPHSPQPGYSITITALTAPVTLASPIPIKITIKNISNRDIWWKAEFGNTAYKAFHVSLTKNGRRIHTTFLYRKIRGEQRPHDPHAVAGGGAVVSSIPPGRSFTETIDLKRLYDITEPGVYELEISRYDKASKTTVHSKVLKLKIE